MSECDECGRFIVTPASHATTCSEHPENDDDPVRPSDYDYEDGWKDDGSCERCPHCKVIYSPNGGYIGTVYDTDGTEYDWYIDTDPTDGPFLCADCWDELETNRKRAENAAITDFGGSQ